MSEPTQYDLIIIGGGPGGYEAALRAAKLGLSTALVERAQLGGTCLNRGCVPTKALLHAAGVYRGMAEAACWGVQAEATLDFACMQARKDAVVTDLREGIGKQLAAARVTVLTGQGSLLAAGRVQVSGAQGTQVLCAPHVLLATGAAPVRLPLPGAELPAVCDSDALLGAQDIPGRLVIVGGGVIGVEFASLFAALGAEVTVLEAADRLLPGMDRELAQNLSMILKKRGVQVHTAAAVQRFEALDVPGARCVYEAKGAQACVEADRVLVCVGRRPCAEAVLAEGCGLTAVRGAVQTDAQGRTALPGVWAIGDLTGGIQLAHVATAQGIAAVEAMAGVPPTVRLDCVPSCVYTDPEIACVGWTADQAKAAGRAVLTGKCVLGGNARTRIAGAERSFMKLVADADTHALLGAQLMCERASDIVGELALAVACGLTLEDMRAPVRAHPTFEEAVRAAVDSALESAARG